MRGSWGWAAGALCLAVCGATTLVSVAGAEGEWRYYSGDNGARKYSPLDQINAENVGTLRVAWRHAAVEPVDLAPGQPKPSNLFRSTPLMVNGVLYASNGVGSAVAIDPATGESIWRQPPDADTPPGFTSNRGPLRHSASGSRRVRDRCSRSNAST